MAGKAGAGGGEIAKFDVNFTSNAEELLGKLAQLQTQSNAAASALRQLNGNFKVTVDFGDVAKAASAVTLLGQVVDLVKPNLHMVVSVDYRQVSNASTAITALETRVETISKKMAKLGGATSTDPTLNATVRTGTRKVSRKAGTSTSLMNAMPDYMNSFGSNIRRSALSRQMFAESFENLSGPQSFVNRQGSFKYKPLTQKQIDFLMSASEYIDPKMMEKIKGTGAKMRMSTFSSPNDPYNAHYNPKFQTLAFNEKYLHTLLARGDEQSKIDAGYTMQHEGIHRGSDLNRQWTNSLGGYMANSNVPYWTHSFTGGNNKLGFNALDEQLAIMGGVYRSQDTADQFKYKFANRWSNQFEYPPADDQLNRLRSTFYGSMGVGPRSTGLAIRPPTGLMTIPGTGFTMVDNDKAYGTGFTLGQYRLPAGPSRLGLPAWKPGLGLPASSQLLLGEGTPGRNLPQRALHMPGTTVGDDFIKAMGWAGGKSTLAAASVTTPQAQAFLSQLGDAYRLQTSIVSGEQLITDLKAKQTKLMADGGLKRQDEAKALKEKKKLQDEIQAKADKEYRLRNNIIRSAYRERDFWYEARGFMAMTAAATTIPYTAGMAMTLDRGANFQSSMQELEARLYDSTRSGDQEYQLQFQADMNALKERALLLGQETVFTAKQIAEAEIEFAKQGFTATAMLDAQANGVDALQAVVTLAAAENLQLGESAYYVATALHGFKMESSDAMKVVNMYAQAANDSALNIADAAHNFAFSAGSIRQAWGAATTDSEGNDLTGEALVAAQNKNWKAMADNIAAWEAAANVGAPRQWLGRYTRGVIDTLSQYDNAMKLRAYDVNVQDDNGNLLGITEIVEQFGNLKKALDSGDIDRRRFNAAMDILPPTYKEYILQLTDAVYKTREYNDATKEWVDVTYRGADAIREMSERNMNARDSTKAWDVAQARMKGFNGAVERLKGSLDTMFINLANSGVLSFATALVSGLEKIVDFIGRAVAIVPGLGPVLVFFGALAAIIPIVLLFMSQFFAMQINIRLASELMKQEIAENGGTMVGLGLSTKMAIFSLNLLEHKMLSVSGAAAIMDGAIKKVTASQVVAGTVSGYEAGKGKKGLLGGLTGGITGLGSSLALRLGMGAAAGGAAPAAAAAGPGILATTGALLTSNPLGWIAAGVIALGAATVGIEVAMYALAMRNKKFAAESSKMVNDVGNLWNVAMTGFGDILNNSVLKPLGDSFGVLLDAIGDICATLIGPLVKAIDAIAVALDPVLDGFLEGFNEGAIENIKKVTDSFYAMAYVLRVVSGDLEGAQEVMDKWMGTDKTYEDQKKKYAEQYAQYVANGGTPSEYSAIYTGEGSSLAPEDATPTPPKAPSQSVVNDRAMTNAILGPLLSSIPLIGKPLANVFGIPHFASGANVTRPTVALVGEEGNETVVPGTGAKVVNSGFGNSGIISTLKSLATILSENTGMQDLLDELKFHADQFDFMIDLLKGTYSMVYNGMGAIYDMLLLLAQGFSKVFFKTSDPNSPGSQVDALISKIPTWMESWMGNYDPSEVMGQNTDVEGMKKLFASLINQTPASVLWTPADTFNPNDGSTTTTPTRPGPMGGRDTSGDGDGSTPDKPPVPPLNWADFVVQFTWSSFIGYLDWMSSGLIGVLDWAGSGLIGVLDWAGSGLIGVLNWATGGFIPKLDWSAFINNLGAIPGNIVSGAADLGGDIVSGVGDFFGFANGGIATKAVAGIFGEAGPEAIIPLSRLPSMIESQMGADRSSEYRNGSSKPIIVSVELDGDVLVRKTLPRISDSIRLKAGL